ncbi:MAG: NUDIX hydrolase [Acidimicrobiales bacterium]
MPPDPPDPPDRPAPPAPERRAARVVLVDPDDAVLLFSGRDPSLADATTYWFTPGGGAEPGEALADAGRREVEEETGHRLGDLGPVLWRRTTSFVFDGVAFHQRESYYVVRVPRFDVRPVALTDFEVRSVTGWRWWPLDELVSTPTTVYPPGLGRRVAGWLDELDRTGRRV